MRVRELKLAGAFIRLCANLSHPMRVRELKRSLSAGLGGDYWSHPMRVRELKRVIISYNQCFAIVAPHAGA